MDSDDQLPRQDRRLLTVGHPTPLIVPRTATCPREGRLLLAVSGNRNTFDVSIADSVASKRMVAPFVR